MAFCRLNIFNVLKSKNKFQFKIQYSLLVPGRYLDNKWASMKNSPKKAAIKLEVKAMLI